jgi:phage-related protein (TIGR01555 family)
MAKTRKTTIKTPKLPSVTESMPGFQFKNDGAVVTPQIETAVWNGLMEAVLGPMPSGIPFAGHSQPLNQTNTLWINNRWYLASNFRQLLSESYVEHGVIQTVVDVPVDDAFRGGIEVHSKELDPRDIELLCGEMEEKGDLIVIGQTCKWNRLFGGAGTVLNVDQDPMEPLNLDTITRFEMYAADMWELFWNKQNTEEYSIAIDLAANMERIEYFQFYGHKLHKSKVLKQKGIEIPSLIRPRVRGWGVSVVEVLINSINQYLKANNLIFEVLDEFKVDYYKIKGLANAVLTPAGTANIRKHLSVMNQQKNYNNAAVMDSEDDWMQRQLSFAGIAETMQGIRMHMACDVRMPLSKIFGISATGFGSGQDDIENYNAMVESQVRQKAKFEILKVVKIRCQLLFGHVPDDLRVGFKSLRILGAEQEENVKTQKFNRVLQARTAGEVTALEFRNAINRDMLLPIQLETDEAALSAAADEKELAASENAKISGKSGISQDAMSSTTPKVAKNSADDDPYPNFVGPKIVTVGIVCGDEMLACLRRDNNKWNNPGGHMDHGESVRAAAVREVFEETGIGIVPHRLERLKPIQLKSHRGGKDFCIYPFIARIKTKIFPTTFNDPDCEFSRFAWVKIDPATEELKADNRHAAKDQVVEHLLKSLKNSYVSDKGYDKDNNQIDQDAFFARIREEGTGAQDPKDQSKNAVQNPGKVDEAKWERAKKKVKEEYGEIRWPVVTYVYKKMGGTFQ